MHIDAALVYPGKSVAGALEQLGGEETLRSPVRSREVRRDQFGLSPSTYRRQW
jgi:hypothetical protein